MSKPSASKSSYNSAVSSGQERKNPLKLLLKDWASDPFTSTKLDLQPVYAHPQYGLPHALSGLWSGRLIFAGTEVAPSVRWLS